MYKFILNIILKFPNLCSYLRSELNERRYGQAYRDFHIDFANREYYEELELKEMYELAEYYDNLQQESKKLSSNKQLGF